MKHKITIQGKQVTHYADYIMKVHEIGDISIVESVDFNDGQVQETSFHAYAKGEDSMCAYDSLDAALVAALAFKYEGHNSQAAKYFFRMVGMDKQ